MQDQFRLQVKKLMLDHGLTITQLARELGFARNTVSVAINHPSMHPTVKQRIATKLQIPWSKTLTL